MRSSRRQGQNGQSSIKCFTLSHWCQTRINICWHVFRNLQYIKLCQHTQSRDVDADVDVCMYVRVCVSAHIFSIIALHIFPESLIYCVNRSTCRMYFTCLRSVVFHVASFGCGRVMGFGRVARYRVSVHVERRLHVLIYAIGFTWTSFISHCCFGVVL